MLNGFKIVRMNLCTKTSTLDVFAQCDQIVSAEQIIEAEGQLTEIFGLGEINLRVKFNVDCSLEQALSTYWQDIVKLVANKFTSCDSVLEGCAYFVENNSITAQLQDQWSNILKYQGVPQFIQRLVADMFGLQTKVTFRDPIVQNHMREVDPMQSGKGTSTKCTKSRAQANVVLGRSFNCSIVNMSDISQDVGTVAISGEIFRTKTREIKNGKLLITFDMTDYTSSLTVKFFVDNGLLDFMEAHIFDGAHVKVRGETQYDRFSKELVIFAKDIVSIAKKDARFDNAPVKRVELHLHTQMSTLDGVTSVERFIERAAAWGHRAIAITDHGVVQAFPDAFSAAKINKIKILYGTECYLLDEETNKTFHAIIFAKNQAGLHALYRMISESHIKHFYRKPRIPKKLLSQNREDLLIGSACEAGELFSAIVNNLSDEEVTGIARFYDYFEVQPLGNNQFLIRSGKLSTQKQLKEVNKRILALGRQLNKLVVATCDVHFMEPGDEVFRRILMAGKGYIDADDQAPLYFRTTDEMLSEFKYFDDKDAFEMVVTNPNKIADMIEEVTPIPNGVFPPSIAGSDDEVQRLAEATAKQIYGNNLPEIVKQRLDKELRSIIKNGFSVMYMIAQKLVQKSLRDGYMVGSRGSVGSSFVAYLIGITEVNSLPAHYVCPKCKYSEFPKMDGFCGFDLNDKICPHCHTQLNKNGYDIPFETFLGFDGDKEPDIDLNFSGEYQPVAHKYVEKLFGKDHVYRAGTIGTIAEKTAFGFVKNYFQDRNITITNAELNRLIKGCTGVKRTTGQHPGGIMIVPQDKSIFEFCPIQRPADQLSSDTITTHFDYHSISGRLLKLDILGHDDPTIIKMLEDLTGVDAKTIPIAEKTTMELFRSTEPLGIRPEDIDGCQVGTLAIPEFGTKFVRQMLVDTKPTTFSELIKISGLSHGTDVWVNNAQTLIKSGTASLAEVICTRDDIMLYLIHSGLSAKIAFNIMEDVRKGKGIRPEHHDIMLKYRIPSWYIDSCNKIRYMFPKAHAAAYVTMAFRIAWFKVYHPESFYCAYFTVRADDFDAELMITEPYKIRNKITELNKNFNSLTQKQKNTLTILEVVNEMHARSIKFLPVDLYESHPVKFILTTHGIRPSLNSLQGLGDTAAQSIHEARKSAKFRSVEDIQIRAKASKTVIEILQAHGCLDGLPESNQMSFI